MGMTLYVKLKTPPRDEWFQELRNAVVGWHGSQQSSLAGGGMLPDVELYFFDDNNARAAEEKARTFPFVESARAEPFQKRSIRRGRRTRCT